MDAEGNITTSLDQVGDAFVQHFSNLFVVEQNKVQCNMEHLSRSSCITLVDSLSLLQLLTDLEIKNATFDIDGFSATFFKKKLGRCGAECY